MNLLLFTYNFPYGKGEAFLENEIDILATNFEKVFIFPSQEIEGKRDIPQNCEVKLFKPSQEYKVREVILKNLVTISKMVFRDIFNKINRKVLSNPKNYFNEIIGTITESNDLNIYLKENNLNENRLFYTYWFYEWTLLLSLIKKKGDKLVTRSHGFDFNLEDYSNPYFLFRPFVFDKVDKNYNVSNFGYQYLKKKYPQFEDKIYMSRLGVKDQEHIVESDGETVVSCSGIIPLKRVHFIVELLKAQKRKIHWVHFGDGEEKENILSLCADLPSNITYKLMGSIPNEEVISWYRENRVLAFIHFSFSEGLPVALMEAQSFGIPILSCDAGGVCEIVNDKTGVLIENDFSLKEAQDGFEKMFKEGLFNREAIQLHQKEFFSAEKNYTQFVQDIKALSN